MGGLGAEKPSQMVDEGVEIDARPAHSWVGRGALKLERGLSLWPIVVEGRVVLDIGASTGGFTHVCLARGAVRVLAVDVGTGQLHPRLRADPRVVNLEGTDARRLTDPGAPISLIVCDVSFISLEKALPAALALAAPGADLVALVKPQFEVGPGKVGKGGIVRDAAARQNALDGVVRFLADSGWSVRATAASPILGGDGNQEWLLWAVKDYSET